MLNCPQVPNVSEQRCPDCARLWAAYVDAAQRHAELVEEQVSAAETNVPRSWLLDALIEIAVQRRNAARAAVEFHRVLEHGKPRAMTAGS